MDTESKIALTWKCYDPGGALALPDDVLSFAPAFDSDSLPLEALSLLPAGRCSSGLLDDIAAGRLDAAGRGVGLFLGDPFLSLERAERVLGGAGATWVTMLPSLAQHESVLRDDLRPVGLTVATELARLAAFRRRGFRTLAVVSSPEDADAVAEHPADAVLSIQTTAEIQISFPSLPQREAAAGLVADRLAALEMALPVLPVVTPAEMPRMTRPCLARPAWAV